MLKLLLVFSVSMFWTFTMSGQSPGLGTSDQLMKVENICFRKKVDQNIKVTGDLNTSTLSVLDKLKFKVKSCELSVTEYFNDERHVVKESTFVSHENYFPEWYVPPSKTINDEKGIKLIFDEENEYLIDGWTGGTHGVTSHGEYAIDGNSRERYFKQEYSRKAKQAYKNHDELARRLGFLYKLVFTPPTEESLEVLRSEGYRIETTSHVIFVENADTKFIWNTFDKVFIHQVMDDGRLLKSTYSYFKYQADFENYVLSQESTITPAVFSNGDCYETVTEVYYLDYQTSCNVSQRQLIDHKQTKEALSIFPNPANDFVNVQLPHANGSAKISVLNISGELLLFRKVDANKSEMKLNIGELSEGTYIIQVLKEDKIYSQKFQKI